MSLLDSIFGKNPADSAKPYLDQIPGVAHGYYDPYINEGREAGGILKGKYGNLVNDPKGFYDELTSGYEPSKAYQYKAEMLSKALQNSASAGGRAGSDYSTMQEGQMLSGLMSEDMQQYLQNVLGLFDRGLEGEKDFYNKGYDATGKMSDIETGNLTQQADLAYKQQSNKNAQRTALIKSIMGIIGSLTGGGLGGIADTIGGGLAGPMSGTPYSPWENPG